jgi:FlgD Ig-like domain
MKTFPVITLGILLLGLSTSSLAAPPLHVWSEGFGGDGADIANTVVVDGAGNIVVSGQFTNTANFGGANLVSAGNTDIFLAKYDANGVHLWSKRFGGTGNDRTIELAVDGADNIIISGPFFNTVDFGGGPLVSAGSSDMFLAKFDASGAHLFSKRFGGTSVDSGWGVATDAAGNIGVCAYFTGTINLGGGNLVSGGGNDMVVGKFDGSGAHLWSKGFGSTGTDSGVDVKMDASGNVVAIGQFSGTVDFGGGPLVSAGQQDAVIAKYDASGAHMWSERFGGSLADGAGSLAIDGSGNVYYTGIFLGTSNYGGAPLVSAGQLDVVLAKYDANGAHQWSERFGGISGDVAQTIVLDAAGNVALAGYFEKNADFGGGPLANAGSGYSDIVIAKYDTNGAHLWSESFGDSLADNANSIAVAGPGSVVVTGFFTGSVDFGGGALVDTTQDVFIAKFSDQVVVPVLISRFNAVVRERGIELAWSFSSDEAVSRFTLYRSRGTEQPMMIANGDARSRSYLDTSAAPGETYHYEVVIRTVSGSEFRSTRATATMPRADITLEQNVPNPFNPETTIRFSLPAGERVALAVYSTNGALVRTLVDGVQPAGSHDVTWDGRDASGRPVSSGVYFYRLSAGKFNETRKMVLLK